jgi:hypothetical protein
MLQHASDFDRPRYNRLPCIELADAEMKSEGKLAVVLAELGPIFARHNMCDDWGISILHKHWLVNDDELPVQDIAWCEDYQEFVTCPRTTKPKKNISPSLFAVEPGRSPSLVPLEFSTDQCLSQNQRTLPANQAFITDFVGVMSTRDLFGTFGLIAVKEVSDPEHELVEFSYQNRVSVIREMKSREIDRKQLIQTSWRFMADASGLACRRECFVTCSVSGSSHTRAHNALHNPNA